MIEDRDSDVDSDKNELLDKDRDSISDGDNIRDQNDGAFNGLSTIIDTLAISNTVNLPSKSLYIFS